ncbi:CgeB family protein [Desulfovibrio gilichinskyi]|uniref:Spore maturation protein CgeB n=1 Tax=Desulfovibrio gilichinskyi TaxID=1519643 RepID=A0A1X7EPD0_9BACT|nr:glycosyltransferase [Desulfovibrio gilichinskyi]SMF37538.1 spore maturation protein CgeB [Desulfovibrio gilichinskyi]
MIKTYSVRAISKDSALHDICISAANKTKHMWGKFGPEKEARLASEVTAEKIPLLIGSGLGIAAQILLEQTKRPLLILDCEEPILAVSDLKRKFQNHQNVCWINTSSPANAVRHILELKRQYNLEIQLLTIHFYLRLSPFYAEVTRLIESGSAIESQTPSWPKFQSENPRILLLTSQYFLMGEIVAACERQSIPHMFINMDAKEMDLEAFVSRISSALNIFRPDFVLTVNHLGVDQEGVLNNLLHKFNIPLASWFVDNPMLLLPLYKAQADINTAIFTWDADRMDSLRDMGFENIFHLPLGTDQTRFKPSNGCSEPKWDRDVSFVGNSMVHKTARRLEAAKLDDLLKLRWKEIAHEFANKSEPSVYNYLKTDFPELIQNYEKLDSPYRKLAFETLIIWQATLEYRLECVKQTLRFSPMIVGDNGWNELLKNEKSWEYHSELSYYEDLPRFYPCSKINFNCTSQQMKGAVNQRVFDVPACNGFILTDHRYQMEKLFEPEKEIAVYYSLDEIPELIEKYSAHPDLRNKIIKAARKRIMAEHTYDCRIKTLINCMRSAYI